MDVESCVVPLDSALPAQLPGHADGSDRRTVSGSGRPACPTAIPIARSCIELSTGSLYWELKDGCGQLCCATRVGTPSPAARPCRRQRPTDSLWVGPAGMSDGHPDSPIVNRTLQSLLGTERWMWTVVSAHSSRHSQPSCPAMPSAQTDGQSLGPAGRHVRRPSRQPDRASECPVSTGTERWMWTVVSAHSSRHSQPSRPAMPTAQTDGQSLGPGLPRPTQSQGSG